MTDLERARGLLTEGEYTCVLVSCCEILTSRDRGVKPLLTWMDQKCDLKDFCAADKVVGRATAFLYVHLGIRQVYARVISRGAAAVFDDWHIPYEYERLVDGIINRTGDGPCPMETAVREISTVPEAVSAIVAKYKSLTA